MFHVRLMKSVPGARRSIFMQVFWQWISLICSCGCSLLLAWLAAQLVLRGELLSVWLTAGFCAALLMVRILAGRQAARQALRSSTLVKKTLRRSIFEKMAELGPVSDEKFSRAERTQLMAEGCDQLETYFAQYLPQFFYALLAPVTLFVLLVFWNWQSALIFLVSVPLIPASIVAVQKFAKKLLAKYWGKYTELSDDFLENLQGLTTLKLYQADGKRHQQMNERAEAFRKATMRVLIMQLNSISVMDLVAYGGTAAGLIVAVSGFSTGSLSLFHCLAIILLSVEFFLPMRLLGSYFHISMNGAAAADKMFAILDTPVRDRGNAMPGLELAVSFAAEELSFVYPDGRQGLKKVSFSMPSTGLIGMTGASGSGKSTLAKLLGGRLDGYQGSLRLGQTELDSIERDPLSRSVLYCDFESMLFAGTVRDNLLAANGQASDQQMIEVLEAVHLKDFLDEKQSLDTPVDEMASNLSGGQRQRLALARMILSDAPVLIFDEATSSMDGLSENIAMEAIEREAKKRLVICISHRLANIRHANQLFVLDHGAIVQSGRHEELCLREGIYQTLWNEQQDLESYADFSQEETA